MSSLEQRFFLAPGRRERIEQYCEILWKFRHLGWGIPDWDGPEEVLCRIAQLDTAVRLKLPKGVYLLKSGWLAIDPKRYPFPVYPVWGPGQKQFRAFLPPGNWPEHEERLQVLPIYENSQHQISFIIDASRARWSRVPTQRNTFRDVYQFLKKEGYPLMTWDTDEDESGKYWLAETP
jgi:hypothetical protein